MNVAAKPSVRLPTEVAEALARGATVLTPGQRAAHGLRRAFAESAAGEVRQAANPEILAVDSWMNQLWARMTVAGSAERMLLNRSQELSLWRRILAEDAAISGLRSLDSLAEMAAAAWDRLCTWGGRLRLREAGVSTDSKAFQRWATGFEQTLNKSACLSSAQLPAALAELLAQGELPVPDAGLLLVDFDPSPPAQAELFDSLERAGYPVARYRTSVSAVTPSILEARDERAELEEAAHWISQALAAEPSTRIAVVVPDLAGRRAQITRVLSRLPDAAGRSVSPSFEFSLGTPLDQAPMIAVALDLLGWCFHPLPLVSISELLLSPFVGGASSEADRIAAAEFDAFELRKRSLLRPELSLEALIQRAEGSKHKTRLANLLFRLKALHHAARSEKIAVATPHPHAEWSDHFRRLLEAAGWTRTAGSNSLAFQLHRRFESALDELATLDFDGSRVTGTVALESLLRITRQVIFAPESRNTPVQIMGPLEVGGVPFDALWFLGAGDLTWPQNSAPSPLLPWQLQRSLGMPGSDPARDRAAALELTRRIAGAAPHVVFSFAGKIEDAVQRRSPALAGLELQPLLASAGSGSDAPRAFESLEDTIPLPPIPDRVTRGGAQVLQNQAACSFRAFAEHRLWSSEPEARSPGMDAMERGSLVHTVMEHFWTGTRTRDELKALPSSERTARLNASIDFALGTAKCRPETAWDNAYLAAQRERLHRLLQPWFVKETERPDFEVQQIEKKLKDVNLGPLHFELRVDRIDKTEGGRLILDYKTGPASPNEWLTDRPDEPQLPLYAILSTEPVAGVAFANLQPGKELGMKGFAASDQVFGKPTKRVSMEAQIEEWRSYLTALAYAFDSGDARPEPKIYPVTCKYCTQRILCRLDPTTLNPYDEDEELEEDYSFG